MKTLQSIMLQWLLLSVLLVSTAVVASSSQNEAAVQAQTDWIRQEGGIVSDKLRYSSLHETFVTLEAIEKDEILLQIPLSCLVDATNACEAAKTLLNDKESSPHAKYVLSPENKQTIPALWSSQGKLLLNTIVGKQLFYFHSTERMTAAASDCTDEVASNDELLDAFHMVTKRSRDEYLVPLLDMISHRNGRYTNVDVKAVDSGVVVSATRDIQPDAPLHQSYTSCRDCKEEEAYQYVLPHIFQETGMVESYPRRWTFFQGGERPIMFELLQEDDDKTISFKWASKKRPNKFQYKVLRGHLLRLRNMESDVVQEAERLESEYEGRVSLQYYRAIVEALDHVVFETWVGKQEEERQQECIEQNGEQGYCSTLAREYDVLDSVSDELEFNYAITDFDSLWIHDYSNIHSTASLYQDMEYKYSREARDTCLYMNNHLHACASFRPHYHEVFVHYPARFLQRDIKRVAFIGGGDNMIVHEILKYPLLELVVGMELDQEVVRSSFLNFGTQPHFDVPELQWWFGDASKSLLMLPEEYYGSFDLVLVDLQNDVVEILKVTEELGFMDAAILLLKEDGVIARNEDWEFHTSEPFTDYTVDLFYVDVPLIAHQGITLGSNTVDFVTQPLKDHGVETIYMKPVEQDGEDPFDKWYNYRKSSNHTAKLCPEPGSSGGNPLLTEEMRSRLGILIAIEAEDVSVPLQSPTDLQAAIREALKTTGAAETAIQLSSEREGGDDGYEIVFVLQEGYLVARAWEKHKYCAFDLMLWSNTDKLEIAKAALVDSVGSKSVSSYRIVMGGMSGVTCNEESRVGPRVAKSCDKEEAVAKEDTAAMEKSTIEAILTETATLIQDGATILVLCGEESDRPCRSLELLKQDSSTNVIPLYTCPNLDTTESMLECETKLLENLEEALGNDKIGGLVIDSKASCAIGQIVHQIFDNTRQRRRLLADSHVVVSLSADASNSGWHKALLDRFRNDMVIFDPAYRADVALDDVELGVFSSGDSRFYTHLTDAMKRVQDKTGVTADIQDVKNGINNYIAGFVPSKTFTHDDYDDTASLQQWNSQQPLGDQTVSQYTTKEPLSVKAIKSAFEYALYKVAGGNDRLYLDVQLYNTGTGCVIVAFWSHGSAVLTFDGNSYMSVNIFSTQGHGKFTKAFQKKISDMSLTMTARDEMPRGIGRVVNVQSDIGDRTKPPHWARKKD